MSDFNGEDFVFFSGIAFILLFIIVVATGMAHWIAGAVGVLVLYLMVAVACGIGYYIAAYTDL